MAKLGVYCLLLIFFSSSTYFARIEVMESRRAYIMKDLPPLYLPEAKYVRLITLGYDNLVADILWFNTINYFGKQYLAGKDYRWFGQMCDLVTKLDPGSIHAFEFCGSLLSWMAKEPEESNRLLTRAIEAHPRRWKFLYMRGFNHWYFLENYSAALSDMKAATKLPNAPAFLASLASRLMATHQNPQIAVEFLLRMLESTKDQHARQALENKLRKAILSRDMQLLESSVLAYHKRGQDNLSDLSELVSSGIIRQIPQEPFGGNYYYDLASKSIKTTSGEEGLTFSGKTAKTGIYRSDFQENHQNSEQ